ncbi:unnamed protein product [Pedinophyceae sp. YPF-701]|nr:unnamed protein product [Pedinophyceae sp. YPF-701]
MQCALCAKLGGLVRAVPLANEVRLLLLPALLGSALGFLRRLWFISVGYGAAVSLVSAAIATEALSTFGTLDVFQLLYVTTYVKYGIRLSCFQLWRELSSDGYINHLRETTSWGRSERSSWSDVLLWFSIAPLYAFLCLPLRFALRDRVLFAHSSLAWAGLAVMWLGLLLESLADVQKQIFKSSGPSTARHFCSTGTFRLCRHPNYLGECLTWVGAWLAASDAYPSCLAAVGAAAAPLGFMVPLMASQASSMDRKAARRYMRFSDAGQTLASWDLYCEQVPSLLPFLGARGPVLPLDRGRELGASPRPGGSDAPERGKDE